ncbi:hypothetical protein V8E53_002300 [Lactarius tabidus]
MATKQTYVVWAPNDTKPEVLERRTALWGDHMNNMMRLVKEGAIKAGGPLFDSVSGDPSGGLIVFEAESLEAVREMIQNDPFWTGNVWTQDRVEIKTIQLTIVGAEQAKPERVLSAVL